MLLAELAAEAGDSSCDVKIDADGGEDDKVADGDEDEAAKDAVTPDASGFCPEELVHVNVSHFTVLMLCSLLTLKWMTPAPPRL